MNRLERQSYDMETLAPMDQDQIQKRQVPIQLYKAFTSPLAWGLPKYTLSDITQHQAQLTPFLTPHTYSLTGG